MTPRDIGISLYSALSCFCHLISGPLKERDRTRKRTRLYCSIGASRSSI